MGLFFKDSNESSKNEETGKVPEKQTTPVITSVIGNAGNVDSKFVDMLNQLIKEHNIAGQDYFEFKQALESMSSLPIAEKDKFVTTYNILSQQGCTKDVLLSSVDKYAQLIQNEQKNFDADLQKQYDARVVNRNNDIEKAKAELELANKRIIELNAFILKTSQEVQTEESNLQNTAANFKKSADVVLNNLLTDKDKINNYIQ